MQCTVHSLNYVHGFVLHRFTVVVSIANNRFTLRIHLPIYEALPKHRQMTRSLSATNEYLDPFRNKIGIHGNPYTILYFYIYILSYENRNMNFTAVTRKCETESLCSELHFVLLCSYMCT